MKLLRIILLLLPVAAGAQSPDLAVPFQRRQLPNGLTVVLVRRPGPGVSARLAARVGGADDPPGASGAARLAARSLAAPAAEGPQEDLDQAWDAVLAQRKFQELEAARAAYALARPSSDPAREAQLAKAFREALLRHPAPAALPADGVLECGPLATVWGADRPGDGWKAWCAALARSLRSLELPGFYHHREALAAAPAPADLARLEDVLRQEAYPAAAAGRPAEGWPSERGRLRRADVRAFAARAFAPANLALVLVGDLGWEDVDPVLAATFGALAAGDPLEPVAHREPLGPADRRAFLDMDDHAAYMVAWKVPGAGHPDHAALEVAAGILAGGRSARLATRLLEGAGQGRLAGVALAGSGRADGDLFLVWAEASGERGPSDLAQVIGGEVERLRAQAPSPDQVARVVAQARGERARDLDDPARLATALARAWALTGDEASYLLALDRLAAVTPESVRNAVTLHLGERRGVQAIGLTPKKAALGDDTLDGDIAELLTEFLRPKYPGDDLRLGDDVRSQLGQILALPVDQKRKVRETLKQQLAARAQEKPK